MKAELFHIDPQTGEFSGKIHGKVDMSILDQNAYKGRYFAYIDPWLNGSTTDEQRKHYWAILGDIEAYTGTPKEQWAVKFKLLYMVASDMTKEPSMARSQMMKEEASKLIQFILDYAIENGVPLRKNYLPLMEQKQLFAMTMKRICWICHQPHADIAHFEAVGMGRNRDKIDHTQHRFISLCRRHHQEQHNMGANNFCQYYNIEPIKLSKENLKELGVM